MKTFAPKRSAPVQPDHPVSEPVIALKRRTIDSVLIALGAVLTAALMVAGALLSWGANFAADYVDDELSSQRVTFPPAAELREEGRTDLLPYAGRAVNTGTEAEAYASFIDGHLQSIADGATYAELGAPEAAAKDAVKAAAANGADAATIAALQGRADAISGQRNSLFKGETLRGLLLSAFAWATVGRIAGYAAFGAFLAESARWPAVSRARPDGIRTRVATSKERAGHSGESAPKRFRRSRRVLGIGPTPPWASIRDGGRRYAGCWPPGRAVPRSRPHPT